MKSFFIKFVKVQESKKVKCLYIMVINVQHHVGPTYEKT